MVPHPLWILLNGAFVGRRTRNLRLGGIAFLRDRGASAGSAHKEGKESALDLGQHPSTASRTNRQKLPSFYHNVSLSCIQ
jgi:hypothetical protein